MKNITEMIDKYLEEKLGLTPKQIITGTYAKNILKYYNDRKDQFKGSNMVDGVAVAVFTYLKSIKEPYNHLSDKDAKYIAKEIIKK